MSAINKLKQFALAYIPGMRLLRNLRRSFAKAKSRKSFNNAKSGEIKTPKILFAVVNGATFSSIESVWRAAVEHEEVIARVMVFQQQNLLYRRTRDFFNLKEHLIKLDVPFLYYSKQAMQDFSPDVVILTMPYPGVFPNEFSEAIFKKTRVVYIPYAQEIGGGAFNTTYQFNLPMHKQAWRIFARSSNHRRMFARYKQNGSANVVVSGSPRTDLYQNIDTVDRDSDELCKKIGNRIAVLWTPHFSVLPEDGVYAWSSFLYIKDHILHAFSSRKDSHFLIFRPHPLLWESLLGDFGKKSIWNTGQVEAFKHEILKLGNSIIDENPDYMISFKASHALIADAGSFLIEYLWMNKPILYTIPPNGYGLNDDSEHLHGAVSLLGNLPNKGINDFISNIGSSNDALKEQRAQARDKIFFRPETGRSVGQEIIHHIVGACQKGDYYVPPVHSDVADEKAHSYRNKAENSCFCTPEYYNRQEKAFEGILEKMPPIETAVDVGCGDGRYTFILAKYAKHVHAADISTSLLTAAKKTAKSKSIKNVKFFGDSITNMLNLSRYNFVSCMGVLAGMISEAQFTHALYCLKSMVKPEGGILLVKESLYKGPPHYNTKNSVYRNIDQYVKAISGIGFELIEKIELFIDKNRPLVNYMFVFKLKDHSPAVDNRRIKGKNISLDSNKINEFFKKRSKRSDQINPYVSAIYQDNDPELARLRDQHEKQLILPRLHLHSTTKLLDMGCGIGRWADAVADDIAHYVGIDFSEELILQARKRFKNTPGKIDFEICSAESVSAENIGYKSYFDCIIIAGVLLYLNDEDVIQCFRNIKSVLAPSCTLYIREPLSVEAERLTLNGVWSEDMSQKYYAIYRTKDELEQLISQGIDKNLSLDFKTVYEDNALNNRKETKHFYVVLELRI